MSLRIKYLGHKSITRWQTFILFIFWLRTENLEVISAHRFGYSPSRRFSAKNLRFALNSMYAFQFMIFKKNQHEKIISSYVRECEGNLAATRGYNLHSISLKSCEMIHQTDIVHRRQNIQAQATWRICICNVISSWIKCSVIFLFFRVTTMISHMQNLQTF